MEIGDGDGDGELMVWDHSGVLRKGRSQCVRQPKGKWVRWGLHGDGDGTCWWVAAVILERGASRFK